MNSETTSAPGNGLMARLRAETREHHRIAESSPLEHLLVAGSPPPAACIMLLEQRLLVHAALERQLIRWRGSDPLRHIIAADARFQTPNLRADLEYLGGNSLHPFPLPATARLVQAVESAGSHPFRVLGFHYVLEGSKNGGRHIARNLREVFHLPENCGTRYFAPHGEDQPRLWNQFREAMDQLVMSAAEQDAVVAAAQQTYEGILAIDQSILERCLPCGESESRGGHTPECPQ